MKLSAPKQITFWIAVVVALVGIITKLLPATAKAGYSGWLLLAGFVILAAGVVLEGL